MILHTDRGTSGFNQLCGCKYLITGNHYSAHDMALFHYCVGQHDVTTSDKARVDHGTTWQDHCFLVAIITGTQAHY